jgi:hypothetical protein
MVYEHKRKFYCPKNKMLECSDFIVYIIQMVRVYKHSLDAISSVAKLHKLFDEMQKVFTKTLYNHSVKSIVSIPNIVLPLKVKCSTCTVPDTTIRQKPYGICSIRKLVKGAVL